MDDWVREQVIDSYCDDDWYGGGSGSDFDYDPNYYHQAVRFGLEYQTTKAYLLTSRKGRFWCPKSLLRDVEIRKDRLTALLWGGFNPEFLPEEREPIEMFAELFAGEDDD